ncbi:MAG: ATP-grasp fold amidoligase family protein [Sphingomicrobium sp.]
MNSIALSPPLGVPVIAPPWARWRVGLFYWWRHGRRPDLVAPQRFTEWVQWRKLNDRRHGLSMLTDKAHAKQVAEARIGGEHVIPTLWLGEVLPAVAPWAMPFIVKANHGCGQFIVVRTNADYARARAVAPLWLARNYGGLLDEWHYRAARRLLLVEPYIGGVALPHDYKVYVFGGRAEVVQLHVGRGQRHRWSQFDRDWTPLSDDPIEAEAPAQLADLLAAAEAMAGQEDFLRVDFYCEGGRLLFGEYCLYPGSGLDPFRPVSLDLMLGARWCAAHSA